MSDGERQEMRPAAADGSSSVMDWQQEFSRGYSRDWRFYRPYLALCLKHGLPGTWVDLGCGPGYFVECCHRYGVACDGLEGDAYAVEDALERNAELPIRRFDILAPLPYPDGSVSVAFCNQVIEHLPPETTVPFLTEARRILAPGGLLFVGSPCRYAPAAHTDLHINLLAPAELNQALLAAGFEEVWPLNYPRFLLGRSTVGKLAAGALFFLLPLDRLASTATAMAFARPDAGARGRILGPRRFHLQRLLRW